MWRWLLMALISLQVSITLPTQSFAAPTSNGPTSDSEAEVLWKEGQEAIQSSRYQDAINALQRYVDRYPGKPHYQQASLYLGQSLVSLGREKDAIPILSGFISNNSDRSESVKARIELSRAYLNLKKYNEAYLATKEAEEIFSQSKISSDQVVETLLVKSQALFGLKRNDQAVQTLNVAENQLTSQNSSNVRGLTYRLQLDSKIRTCEYLNLKGSLDESQIRHHLVRRGGCLLEALLIFRKNLETNDTKSSKIAMDQLEKAFGNYFEACAHPPFTAASRRSSRTLSQYKKELTEVLAQDCRKTSTQAVDLLETWKNSIPSATQIYANKLSQNLNQLTSRNP